MQSFDQFHLLSLNLLRVTFLRTSSNANHSPSILRTTSNSGHSPPSLRPALNARLSSPFLGQPRRPLISRFFNTFFLSTAVYSTTFRGKFKDKIRSIYGQILPSRSQKNSLLRQKSGPGLRRAPIILIQSASGQGSQHEPQRRIGINLIVSCSHSSQNIVHFHSQDTKFLIKGFQTYIPKVSNCTIFRSPPAHHRNYSLYIIHHFEILYVHFDRLFRPLIPTAYFEEGTFLRALF